ncbi:MAG: transcriptional regulator [Micrococcaceae bacterium]|uniref:winged helix-turn-helix domain-containing protein n=1 Tax=Arthrobacter sp. 179 TaxID=3457734 RepID=UPI002656282E|nr:transcriptional regulator [Micrococcaceae bacterium]MDN5825312.1 transcriptional regulator [Micrococcaceae bacterium]MDN5879522.1 transcriptional regulator [Micrococcaceae bacterium]MDN5887430.1 transcriptional regulator [Micrococcaceae bacterium]MDN5905927.1 transcriptional regulator [Micrococcaceae bacterium]
MSPATDRHDEHPRMKLSEPLAHPVRFSLVAAIAGTEETEFAVVRDHLQVSDSVLSRQASQLEAAGIVKIRKGFVGKRPRTWFSLTRAGRGTWERHLAALRDIAGGG